MMDERYRQELERIGMSDAFRQALVETLATTSEEEKPVKKRVFRTVLIAAALCAALVVTAFAVSPTLREALAEALGSFAPYSQSVEGVSATDQGIQIKVVSALMDEVDGTAYVEVTDLTGDRLGMDMELREGYHRLQPQAYDPETRTALFAVPLNIAINELEQGRAEELELSFDGLRPGVVSLYGELRTRQFPDGTSYAWWQGVDIPKTYYSAQTLATRSLTEEEKGDNFDNYADLPVLVSNQTPADLGCEYVSLSSAGFDADGALHIQLEMAPGAYLEDVYGLNIDVAPSLRGADIGLPDGIEDKMVLLEGGKYLDVVFPEIGPELLPLLPNATVLGEVRTASAIEGTWELSFPYAPLQETVVALDQPFCYSGFDLVDARLTAMSFQLTFTPGRGIYMGGMPARLFCKDGTILELDFYDQTMLYQNAAGEIAAGPSLTYEQHRGADGWREYAQRDSWRYPQAVAPEDVAGVSFGLWYVPLDGSGGYWLPEQPQPTAAQTP